MGKATQKGGAREKGASESAGLNALTGHLGSAGATGSGRPPSPAEDYANTGQAATGPGLREPDGSDDIDDVGDLELDYPSVRTTRGPGDPLANRSGVGPQQRSESDLEQPRGDGHYRKEGDRDIAIDTNPDPDTTEQ
jgi:hypothetical protein